MKKIQLLLLFGLTLALISCEQNKNKSSEINDTKTKAILIVGTWKLIEISDLDTLTGCNHHLGQI